MSTTTIKLNVTFSGGCEILFGTRSLSIDVPSSTTLGSLVVLLKDKIVERPDQFIVNNNTTLRPGILALVNDTDGDLLGGSEYNLEDNDQVSFISTLHGG